MDSFPSALVSFIELFRALFRAEVLASFGYLITGLLIGEAKYGTVRASVCAAADYWPPRLSDLYGRHKVSPQAFMAKLVAVALAHLSPAGWPARLFWMADATHAAKPSAKRVASIGLFHRTTRVAGRAKHLTGPCDVCAAHLYQHPVAKASPWSRGLVGALRSVKGCAMPPLVGALATQLRRPAERRHIWRVDRGLVSRPLLHTLGERGHLALGRVRGHPVVDFAPCPETSSKRTPNRRPRIYGDQCRVDQWRSRYAERLRAQKMMRRVRGRERIVNVWDAAVLRRGGWCGRVQVARVLIITVPGLQRKPWDLITTDRERKPCEAVRASEGRDQLEVNSDAVKELGLEHYPGRSGQGVRRWPLFLCLGQMILKCMATGRLPVQLPERNWSWYTRADTVGQGRRRLVEACRPRISRAKADGTSEQKLPQAA